MSEPLATSIGRGRNPKFREQGPRSRQPNSGVLRREASALDGFSIGGYDVVLYGFRSIISL